MVNLDRILTRDTDNIEGKSPARNRIASHVEMMPVFVSTHVYRGTTDTGIAFEVFGFGDHRVFAAVAARGVPGEVEVVVAGVSEERVGVDHARTPVQCAASIDEAR
jgi:hypothetical protein